MSQDSLDLNLKENKQSYKQSLLQTEGNFSSIKKRGMHIKLSSITSDKDLCNNEK